MKTAMIWGAGGGIGQALLQLLQDDGWRVIALSRSFDELLNEDVLAVEVDVGKEHSVQDAVLSASFEIEEVDLWIYAMGDISSARLDQLSPDLWKRIMAANLDGAFLATHFSLPLLAEDAHLFFLGAISER
jgi:NADP-dependent 3-hydroxy acid dehydrogenase YdfG